MLLAPRSGVVGEAPVIDDVGKYYDRNPDQPFCTIDEPGKMRVCLPLPTSEFNRLKENLERNTPSSNATRRLLQRGVRVHYDKTRLADVFADLQKQVPGLRLKGDAAAGADDGLAVTFQAEKQRLSSVLDRMFGQYGLGYVVQSQAGASDDGWLLVRPGRERGYPEGPRLLADLGATVCIQGRAYHDFKGKVAPLPEAEAHAIPFPLTSRAGGPVAVKAAPNGKTGAGAADATVPRLHRHHQRRRRHQGRQHGRGEGELPAGDLPAMGVALGQHDVRPAADVVDETRFSRDSKGSALSKRSPSGRG